MRSHRDDTAWAVTRREALLEDSRGTILTLGRVSAIVVTCRGERDAAGVAARVGFRIRVGILASILGMIGKGIQLVVARARALSHGEKRRDASETEGAEERKGAVEDVVGKGVKGPATASVGSVLEERRGSER